MKPTADQVTRLREQLQQRRGIGITDAQRACADLVYSTLRGWQNWERGERPMHPGLYELARIKIGERKGAR